MVKKPTFIEQILYYAILICICCISYVLMNSSDGALVGAAAMSDGIYFFTLIVACTIYIFIGFGFNKTILPLHKEAICFSVIVLFSFFIDGYFSFTSYIRIFAWVFVLFFSYFYFLKYPNQIKIAVWVFSIFVLILIYKFVQSNNLIRFKLGINQGLSSSYWILLYLPVAIMIKNRIISNTIIVFIGLTVFYAFKSTGIITFSLSLICYSFVETRFANKSVEKLFLRIIMLAILLYVFVIIFNFVQEKTDFDWMQKLDKSLNQGGSGRDKIWSKTWYYQQQSSLTKWLIGHGRYGLVPKVGNIAHNDYLETLAKNGIFAVITLIGIVISTIKYIKKMYRERFVHTASYIVTCVCFIIISLFSVIVNTGMMIIPAFFWGMLIAEYSNKGGIETISEKTNSQKAEEKNV